jgi:hypothetical protein
VTATAEKPLKAPFEGGEMTPAVWRGLPLTGYFVQPDGSVWSLWQRDGSGRIRWSIGETYRPIQPYRTGRTGQHLGVALRHQGKTYRINLHRLIAEVFIGPCPPGKEVCHNDGNGCNNSVPNLRYGTKAENQADKNLHGTNLWGERNHAAKLTDRQAEEIRRLRASGSKLADIAGRYGVRESTVSRIANGVRRGR